MPRPRHTWRLRSRTLHLGDRTLIMGILNITPDSFSDGGRFLAPEAAVQHGLDLLDQGADILDLGAESTRPNASPLSPQEEQQRLLPVLGALHRACPDVILSVDTYHASTARLAIGAGAEIINDVSGLTWDPAMTAAIANATPSPGLVLMHTRGTPQTWARLPPLEAAQVGSLVRTELSGRLEAAISARIAPENILLDPGFGFGKLGPENFALLALLDRLHTLGRPLLVGLSRKGFLAHAPPPPKTNNVGANASPDTSSRLYATIAANTAAILAGAHVLRVHDVPAALQASAAADAILAALDTE